MKAGFTKGEWKYHEPKGVFHARLGSSNGETIAVFKTTPLPSDAQILSAAPDLAEALADCVEPLRLYAAYGWPDRNNVIAKALATLKKAGVEL